MRDCSWVNGRFENLALTGFNPVADCTSDRTIDKPIHHNCIAWAAGNETQWWWPWDLAGYYWPEGLPKELPSTETVKNFVDAFKSIGYEECDNGAYEAEYEKIAIFVNAKNTPTHAARSLPDGTWTSKLGEGEDIRHASPAGLEGREYGRVVAFLRRRW